MSPAALPSSGYQSAKYQVMVWSPAAVSRSHADRGRHQAGLRGGVVQRGTALGDQAASEQFTEGGQGPREALVLPGAVLEVVDPLHHLHPTGLRRQREDRLEDVVRMGAGVSK